MINRAILFCSLFFVSCNVNEQDYFNGEIRLIDECNVVDSISGERVVLDEDPFGTSFHIIDSLLFINNWQSPDFLILSYNHITGKRLKKLFGKGRAQNEFIDISGFYQHYKNDEGKTLAVSYSASKQAIVTTDINESINGDIKFSLSKLRWDKYNMSYGRIFNVSTDVYLGRVQDAFIDYNGERCYMLKYDKINVNSGEIEAKFEAFPKLFDRKKAGFHHLYYGSDETYNRKQNKLVMTMSGFSQMNILDVNSGEMIGYRVKGTPDFVSNRKDPQKLYYVWVVANDKYIYGLYSGANYYDGISYSGQIVNVFDWNGKMVRKLHLSQKADMIGIDECSDSLIACCINDSGFYRYKLETD